MSTSRPSARAAPFVRGLATIALALAAVACASTTSRRAQMLSDEAVTLDLPFVPQDALHECGLVSISALCQYWNVAIPADERARLAQLAKREEGLSGGELQEALDGLGFETFLFPGTLDHAATGVFGQVDAGRPLLVMIAPEPGKRHYVLFLGYDEPERDVCLLDPVRGRVIVPYEAFERTWSGCDRFTLLAVPVNPSSNRAETPEKEAHP
jgi:ABC-type bacteriocin/lantibiotic exporter with double-glycine peptidase domain